MVLSESVPNGIWLWVTTLPPSPLLSGSHHLASKSRLIPPLHCIAVSLPLLRWNYRANAASAWQPASNVLDKWTAPPPKFLSSKFHNWPEIVASKNISRLQKAALSTGHQVVPIKVLFFCDILHMICDMQHVRCDKCSVSSFGIRWKIVTGWLKDDPFSSQKKTKWWLLNALMMTNIALFFYSCISPTSEMYQDSWMTNIFQKILRVEHVTKKMYIC